MTYRLLPSLLYPLPVRLQPIEPQIRGSPKSNGSIFNSRFFDEDHFIMSYLSHSFLHYFVISVHVNSYDYYLLYISHASMSTLQFVVISMPAAETRSALNWAVAMAFRFRREGDRIKHRVHMERTLSEKWLCLQVLGLEMPHWLHVISLEPSHERHLWNWCSVLWHMLCGLFWYLYIFVTSFSDLIHEEYSGMGMSPWIEASQQVASKLILLNIRWNNIK